MASAKVGSDRKPRNLKGQINRSKIIILIAAFISFLLSVYLWFVGQQQAGIFVGLWVPSIIGLGSLMIPGNSVDQTLD